MASFLQREVKTVRKLMLITIGFVISLFLCVYIFQLNYCIYLIALFCLAGIGFFLLRKRIVIWKHIICIIIGCIFGVISVMTFDAVKLNSIRQIDGQTISTTVEITEYSKKNDNTYSVEGIVNINGKRCNVLVYYRSEEQFKPGDTISGEFKLQYTGVGGDASSTYYQGNGIFLLAFANDDFTYNKCQSIPNKYFAAKMRNDVLNILQSVFPDDTRGFSKALLLGDSSDLPFHIDNAFKVSGIRHIIAVSGLHVSILFSFVYILAGKRRFLTAMIGIPILVFFAAVAGFTPSVVRACIMQCLLIVALLLNREYDPPTALSFAVAVMLLINPLAITSVSLQLSAGCMVGIFAFSGKIKEFLLDDKRLGPAKGKNLKSKLIRWFAGSVSVSAGAMIFTISLSAYYFGMVSIIGVLTNLLTLWVVSFIFYGIMLVCIIYLISPIAAQLIAAGVSWLMRYLMWIAELLADIPFAAVYTCSIYTVFWIVFAYILILCFFLLKKRKPFILFTCIATSLFVCIFASYLEPKFDNARMTVMDVGQGQCILLQSNNKNYLVDCGGDGGKYVANDVINLLKSQSINKLDAVILSHFDKDHAAGAEYLLSVINTDALYVTTSDPESEIDERLYAQYGNIYNVVSEMTVLGDEGASVKIYPGEIGKSSNENSLCVLFQAADCDILITGDRSISAENALIEKYDIPKIDIMVAGHHGSDNSAGFHLLSKAEPESVVISVGKNNSFGHPGKETIKRLELFGCNIYRTDMQGTIVFRR